MSDPNGELRKLVDASGFTFQLAITDLVRKMESRVGWRVLFEEHAWRNPHSANEGFIDLVLERERMRLVVECKRPTGAQWVFQNATESDRLEVCCSLATRQTHGVEFTDLPCSPGGFVASVCVVRGSGEEQKPMLERLARTLIEATEGLADEQRHLDYRAVAEGREPGTFWLFAPVIVTTAELVVCFFDPASVDVTTGKLPTTAEFKSVPAIRFSKNLVVSGRGLGGSLAGAHALNNRTVFVVQSAALENFLRDFWVNGRPPAVIQAGLV